VGFIHRGEFHLLFSAGCPLGERQPGVDVPVTFEELAVGTTVFGKPRPAGHLRIFQEPGAGPGVSASTTPCVLSIKLFLACLRNAPRRSSKPGVVPLFKLTGNRGAALVTRYPTYGQDALSESVFQRYTMRHYDSWVAFACHKGLPNVVRPVIVSGFDMTRDFAMVAYSNMGGYLESDPTLAILMPTPNSSSAWGTWCTSRPCDTNCGPRQCDLSPDKQVKDLSLGGLRSIPSGFNQCTFVRYCTVRKGPEIPRLFKGLQANRLRHPLLGGGTFPESTVQSGAEPTTSGNENLGRQRGPITSNQGLQLYPPAHNTPRVWFLPCPFFSALTLLKDREGDNLGHIANGKFKVTHFSASLLGHST